MRDACVIEIDLSAIDHNMRVLRRLVGPAGRICPVVKADGYGLGAARVAKCLLQAGAEMVAVYTGDQAAELFRAAAGGPVLVLMPLRDVARNDELYRALIRGQLHLSVHDADHLEDLLRLAEQYGLLVPVHLEVDTGMNRAGCSLAEAPAVLSRIAESHRLTLAGLYTHFASAETDAAMTDRQHDAFVEFFGANRALIPADCLVHLANTAATLRDRRYHHSMVRVGQAWAGYGPEWLGDAHVLDGAWDLRPCLTWSSRIIQLKVVQEATTVGYGATWTARRRSLLGLVPIGYADGYPLALSGSDGQPPRAQVAVLLETVEGALRTHAPVVGAVNMDQITIDLTDLTDDPDRPPAGLGIGTPVELITPDRDAPNHLVTLARAASTNPYDILCRLSPRIRRMYYHAAAAGAIVTSTGAPARADTARPATVAIG